MRIRRRSLCFLQIDDELLPNLEGFLRGHVELIPSTLTALLCPLTGQRISLTPDELELLQAIPSHWIEHGEINAEVSSEVISSLRLKGALLSEDDEDSLRIDAYERASEKIGWHPIASLYHGMTKWSAVIASDLEHRNTDAPQREKLERMAALHGPAPSHIHAQTKVLSVRTLQPVEANTALDKVLLSRQTTRHYALQAKPTTWQISQILGMTFGFTGAEKITASMTAMKRTSPSGGALHPIEAYPVILDVEGLAAGVYHYDSHTHELKLLRHLDAENGRELISRLLIGQHFFADASAVIFHVGRVDRHHWKYRRHPKAYKALLLDSGHLSQTFYLKSTALGLGCFFTAAINDADVESLLELDAAKHMVIGANGLGVIDVEKNYLHLSATPMHSCPQTAHSTPTHNHPGEN